MLVSTLVTIIQKSIKMYTLGEIMSELTFHEKLVAIQSELVASKDKENKFGGFSYRTAEGILAAVKPHLAKHGLFLTIQDDIVTRGEGERERFYLQATVTITDGSGTISVSALARESLSKKGMDDAQVTGASSSYARKYCLNGMFAIDDSKQDPDTNHGSDEMNSKVDEILAKCATREEAIEKLGAIRKSKMGTPSVLKYAAEKFKEKFPQ